MNWSVLDITTKIEAFCLLFLVCACNMPMQPSGSSMEGLGDRQLIGDPALPKIRVILIADTLDHAARPGKKTISRGVQSNAANMMLFFTRASQATNMGLDLKFIGGQSFSCENINKELQNVPVDSGDVAVVYYAGHGFNFREPQYSIFSDGFNRVLESGQEKQVHSMPYIYCGKYDGNPNLFAVSNWASRKSPKLTLIISDSCNNYIDGPEPRGAPISVPAAVPSPAPDQRLIGLFAEARGTVIMAATSPGYYAFYDEDGGRFTKQFLEIFDRLPRSSRANWDMIATNMKPMRAEYENQIFFQTPVFFARND